jgi:hypothetical protein
MLSCKNKMFSKFLFFSLFFLVVSVVINSVIVYAVEPSEKNRSLRDNSAEIQIQQRKILNHLEKIEDRMIITERRLDVD